MPFSLASYASIRPYLYHLTARENLDYLRSRRGLDSAAALLTRARREGEVRTKRPDMTAVTLDGQRVLLRDQSPLHEANIGFAPGWTFADVLADLNRRVFFWPGEEYGPVKYGRRYIQRQLDQNPIVLRVRLDALLRHNPGREPFYCRYNSGSPRWSGKKPSPRGPDTFLPADRFPGGAGAVVEATFLDRVDLPEEAEYTALTNQDDVSDRLDGQWGGLFPVVQ